MKITPRQVQPRAILSDEIISALMQVAPKAFGEQLYQLVQDRKFDLEGNLRFRAVSVRCKEARDAMKMGLKDVSLALAVPQYRIKDIENGSQDNIIPEVLHRYLALIGLSKWYEKWAKANPKLATRFHWDAGPSRALGKGSVKDLRA